MKDDEIYLEYILECIDQIQEYAKDGKIYFMESSLIQDAVTRKIANNGRIVSEVI